jgi:TatD DNase family protein
MDFETKLSPHKTSRLDSHAHLADPRIEDHRPTMLQKAYDAGIRTIVQGGVHSEDWQKQLDIVPMAEAMGLRIVPVFGIHPYTVAAFHQEAKGDELFELELDKLSRKISQAFALGEVGLDFRPHIAKGSEELQKVGLVAQLELAAFTAKPVVIHCVRAHDEFLRVFEFGIDVSVRKKIQGMVHAFNGSWPEAQDFLNLGFMISVGGALVREGNERLRQAVKNIPMESLLLESDTPDQKPDDFAGNWSDPTLIFKVAEQVAILKKMRADEVLDITTSGAEKLFSL